MNIWGYSLRNMRTNHIVVLNAETIPSFLAKIPSDVVIPEYYELVVGGTYDPLTNTFTPPPGAIPVVPPPNDNAQAPT